MAARSARAASRPHCMCPHTTRVTTSTRRARGRNLIVSAKLRAAPRAHDTARGARQYAVSEEGKRTHDDIMPEHITLPHPPEAVIAHHPRALDVVARVRRELERFELTQVPPELLEKQGQRDAQERRNASVAHEVRHVWIPRHAILKRQHPTTNADRRKTHVRATSSANASVL